MKQLIDRKEVLKVFEEMYNTLYSDCAFYDIEECEYYINRDDVVHTYHKKRAVLLNMPTHELGKVEQNKRGRNETNSD